MGVGTASKILRDLMTSRDVRIKDLMRLTGISRPTISRHVRGIIEPNYEQREKYAGALGIPFPDFERMWQGGNEAGDRKPSSKHQIRLTGEDGQVVELPDELVLKMEARAKADGVPFMDWFSDFVRKNFQTKPPGRPKVDTRSKDGQAIRQAADRAKAAKRLAAEGASSRSSTRRGKGRV